MPAMLGRRPRMPDDIPAGRLAGHPQQELRPANGKGKGITVNTADQAYIGAIIGAVNAYATAMEAFTAAAATTAAGTLAASIATATSNWQASLHNEGE